jgi:hypothetical protein
MHHEIDQVVVSIQEKYFVYETDFTLSNFLFGF